MLDFIQTLTYWHWLGFGVVLLILELVTSSGFLLWIGLSAGMVGFLLWLIPGLTGLIQCLIFAITSVATVAIWTFFIRKNPNHSDHPYLNRRAEQYIDRVFTLTEPVRHGTGKIRVDDSVWRIRCEDCPAGTKVKIVDVDGVILIGKKV